MINVLWMIIIVFKPKYMLITFPLIIQFSYFSPCHVISYINKAILFFSHNIQLPFTDTRRTHQLANKTREPLGKHMNSWAFLLFHKTKNDYDESGLYPTEFLATKANENLAYFTEEREKERKIDR